MRSLLLTLCVVAGLSVIPAIDAGNALASGPAFGSVVYAADSAETAQPPQISVEIDEGGKWYASPVWIAIGVIAAVVVLMLIIMAFRGNTTVVK